MIHELKTIQPYFCDIQSGAKTFEVRKNDRYFQVGDYLALNEFEDIPGVGVGYAGRCMLVKITYVLNNSEYCKDGYVILGIIPCRIESTDGTEINNRNHGIRNYGAVPVYGERSIEK